MVRNQNHNGDQVILNDLTFMYGDLKAVDSLNLVIRKDEIPGFPGPNGAGKITAIRMICRLLKPVSGEILIKGKSWSENPENRKLIGYPFFLFMFFTGAAFPMEGNELFQLVGYSFTI